MPHGRMPQISRIPRILEITRVLKISGKYFQLNLNWLLLIFKALIRASRVDGAIWSLTAAPDGPETRPLVSARAASIFSRSVSGSPLEDGMA